MAHTCHAVGCTVTCSPAHLMCWKHWRMVPARIQTTVYRYYKAGQERGKYIPTPKWHAAADLAIHFVSWKEGHITEEQWKLIKFKALKIIRGDEWESSNVE